MKYSLMLSGIIAAAVALYWLSLQIRPAEHAGNLGYDSQEAPREAKRPHSSPASSSAIADREPVGSGLHALDIDFGPWKPAPSRKTGPAAAGAEGDFWNTVAVAWNDDHTESNLLSVHREKSPIRVRLVNLGGGWSTGGRMAIQDPMLDDFNYPAGNKGGNSDVYLYDVPPGQYHLYLYGHGTSAAYYGDYTVTVGERSYGRKATANNLSAVTNTAWVEGSQYVKFSNIRVSTGETIQIFITPGGPVTDGRPGTFSDTMIAGLQLIPASQGQDHGSPNYIQY